MNNLPQAKTTNIVVQELGKEILVYDLIRNQAFNLNETTSAVWNLCDGRHSASQISEILSRKTKYPVTEDLVFLALDQLKKEELLENSEGIKIDFGGVSRREVIRRVGIGSMIALPLVMSLVAPKASMAQSTCNAYSGSCGSVLGQCCPGLNCTSPDLVVSRCCYGTTNGPDNQFLGCTFSPTNCSNLGPNCCSGQANLTNVQGNCAAGFTECRCAVN